PVDVGLDRNAVGPRRRFGVGVVLDHEDRRQVPDRGQVEALQEHALVRGAVADEAHGHVALAPRLGRQGGAAGQRSAGAEDAVGPHHPDVELGDVHGAALALAAPALAPVDLLHHRPGVDALGDAVAVAPAGGGDPGGRPEVHPDAGGGGLLAGVEVHEAGDVTPGEVDVEA